MMREKNVQQQKELEKEEALRKSKKEERDDIERQLNMLSKSMRDMEMQMQNMKNKPPQTKEPAVVTNRVSLDTQKTEQDLIIEDEMSSEEEQDSYDLARERLHDADKKQKVQFGDRHVHIFIKQYAHICRVTDLILDSLLMSVAKEMSTICDQFVGNIIAEEWAPLRE